MLDIFEFVDLDDSRVIEFKEFLVALTVAHALDIIPVDESKVNARRDSFAGVDTLTVSAVTIKALCSLIVSAYLLFDPSGLGYITRNGVKRILEEGSKGKEGRGNGIMSQQRWEEMVCALSFI